MHNRCQSINDMVLLVGSNLMKNGVEIDSRNGKCKELDDIDVIIADPQARHLCLPGRKNNIFATIAEVFWVFANNGGVLDPFLTFFLRRAPDYSDDGVTWPDYYGTRIWQNDQIGNILDMYQQDGINTRRAVMTIWRPDMDTTSIRGPEKSRAIPCSQWLGFWVRDGFLNCKFQMRSNDIIFGTTINIMEFTILQEIITRLLTNALGYSLDLGYFHYSSLSTHIYEPYFEQMAGILSHEEQPNNGLQKDDMLLGGIKDSEELGRFFGGIYGALLHGITYGTDAPIVDRVFAAYDVPIEDNMLYQYAAIVEDYISYKKRGVGLYNLGNILCQDLKYAIVNSPFKPEGMIL